jgi:hypothetical protein
VGILSIIFWNFNKMNCELMITYDTPALRQTGSRNLTGQKMLPTIWGTYMKLLWVVFLDQSDSYFLFADLVGFYTHWTYIHIFCHIFFSNYWWQRSGIWSQASYRYPISWEAFLDPSDSYFLFADLVGLISDFCHQQLLRKMWRKISWTDGEGRTEGQTDGQR